MAEDNPPKGMQLTPFDEAYKTYPYEVLKGLRENLPVYYDDEFAWRPCPGSHVWRLASVATPIG
jgi:hypothetical protein